MKVTKENYFSKEASKEFNGVSQFKSFTGGCSAKEMDKLNGKLEEGKVKAFMQGHYVHAWSEGNGALEKFRENNPEMFYKSDKDKPVKERRLLKTFQICESMIDRLESFDLVTEYLTGEKEIVIEFELYGQKWKSMIDVVNLEEGRFVDLKTTRGIDRKYWNDDFSEKVSFVEKYNYPLQMAVYQKALYAKYGVKLHPFIVAVDKSDIPDVAIIDMEDEERFEKELAYVEEHIESVNMIKAGLIEPTRCEKCDYCKSTKKIDRVISYKEL